MLFVAGDANPLRKEAPVQADVPPEEQAAPKPPQGEVIKGCLVILGAFAVLIVICLVAASFISSDSTCSDCSAWERLQFIKDCLAQGKRVVGSETLKCVSR